jgi:hypothetical protein
MECHQMKTKFSVLLFVALILVVSVLGGVLASPAYAKAETDVSVKYFGADGSLLHEDLAILGEPIPSSPDAPEVPGQTFAYWYSVDDQLIGNSSEAYDFSLPVQDALNLYALYQPLPIPEETDAGKQANTDQSNADLPDDTKSTEETGIVDSETDVNTSGSDKEEVVVRLSVALAVEGGEIEDGAYQALLTGANLPETGIPVDNVGESFPFPELVFTAEDMGTHVFYIEALAEEPLPLHTYDLEKYEVLVEVLEQQDGQITALVSYPQEADCLLITHSVESKSPAVRVYTNIQPGQTVNYGDEVVFTAEIEYCGDSPHLQWQYSPDNETWTDIAGGNGATFSVLITPSNASGYWRVVVTITD